MNHTELYDVAVDPSESRNVIADHPGIAAQLRAAYDKWWSDVQSLLIHEDAVRPKINPPKELYWKQFGGGPDTKLLEHMDRKGSSISQRKRNPKPTCGKKREEAKAKCIVSDRVWLQSLVAVSLNP